MQVARVCTRVEDGLMPIVPVSLPDSEAPPPDESVGPIPVGPHSPAPWGHIVLPWSHMHCGAADTRADTPNALLPHCNFVLLCY